MKLLASVAAACLVVLSQGEVVRSCSSKDPFDFALLAAGAVEEEVGNVLDLLVAPDQAFTFEVTAYLENLAPERDLTVRSCTSLFAMSVAHDGEVFGLDDVTMDGTDFGQIAAFRVAFPAAPGTVPGFMAADVTCLGIGPPFTFRLKLSVVRVRYTLVAPHGSEMLGKMISSTIRFQDGIVGRGLPVTNIACSPIDGHCYQPCTRDLQVRIHVGESRCFIRGDANFDQRIDVSDAVTTLRALFSGDARIRCEDAADADDDGQIDVSDAVRVFSYLFEGGPRPAAPFPEAGEDPTPDRIFCVEGA